MKKLSYLLIVSMLLGNAYAVKYSDKTYFTARPQLSNLAMQQTTWHNNLYQKPDTKYKGTIQIVPFYQESINKSDIGKYFGFNWGGTRGIENIISVESPNVVAGPNETNKVFSARYIIHDQASAGAHNAAIQAQYSMSPYQETIGARIDYNQDLDKILNGLYFRASTQLVEIKNNFNTSNIGAQTSQQIPGIQNTSVSLLDYLAGRVSNTTADNVQAPLKYAKIDGGSHSSSGFADIDLRLGYKYLYKRRTHASINLSMLIPTGKTPKGEWLFEPVHGNGHHWGIGFGLDLSVTLWKHDNKSIEFMIAGDYKYLFQGIEKRTLDFREANPNSVTPLKGGHYLLGGENGKKGVFPLANILTRDFKVTPENQFDAIANFTVNYKKLVFDLGYNFFVKEKEGISLRHPWENDKYAIAGITYNTNNDFNLLVANDTSQSYAYNGAAINTNAAIQKQYLDFESVRSPNAVTHKFYGGIGYQWNKDKYPAMLGIGGAYEIVQRNSSLETWSLWTKVGISW